MIWLLPWGDCSSDCPPSQWRDFSQCPIWTYPDAASFYFFVSYYWPAERDQHLPFHCPPWRSCRLRWGHLLAFSSLSCTNQVTSDLHRSVFRWVLPNSFISNPDIQTYTKKKRSKISVCREKVWEFWLGKVTEQGKKRSQEETDNLETKLKQDEINQYKMQQRSNINIFWHR